MPSSRAQRPPRRVRAYWRSRGVLARLPRGLPSLVTGLWLGAFRPSDLHAINDLWYGGQLERYAAPEYVASGLFAWERDAIARWFPPGARVLVAAAGAGREVLALDGYAVCAFECHAALRARGAAALAARGADVAIRPAPPDRCPPLAGPFDAIVVGWSAYMFIPTVARRVAFLSELRALASGPGTPVLLSFATRDGRGRARRGVQVAIANGVRRVRRAEPAARGDALDPYFLHRFTAAEIGAELSAGGFAAVETGPADGGAYAVARARG